MLWLLGQDATIEVGRYEPIRLPPPLVEATRRYAGTAKLEVRGAKDDPCRLYLTGWAAGLPFPTVDLADPLAAAKLMFDHVASAIADTLAIDSVQCEAPVDGEVWLDFRKARYMGRLMVDPRPAEQPNEYGWWSRTGIRLLAPFVGLKGVKIVADRFFDPKRLDETNLYLPQLRRVRHLSAVARSYGFLGGDIDLDSLGGFDGKVNCVKWKLLGQRTLLLPMHGKNVRIEWKPPPEPTLPQENWEPRRVWVIEGSPGLRDDAYKRRVLYLDQETYEIPYAEMYDRTGELWKVWLATYRVGSRPFPLVSHGAKWQSLYVSGATMFDTQLSRATRCRLPGEEQVPGNGWHINEARGFVPTPCPDPHAVDPGYFTCPLPWFLF